MLVLSRKKRQTVVIGGNITVTVVEVRGDKVRLGIVAPREVPVDREEIHLAREAARKPLSEAFQELREAGGHAWDGIDPRDMRAP